LHILVDEEMARRVRVLRQIVKGLEGYVANIETCRTLLGKKIRKIIAGRKNSPTFAPDKTKTGLPVTTERDKKQKGKT